MSIAASMTRNKTLPTKGAPSNHRFLATRPLSFARVPTVMKFQQQADIRPDSACRRNQTWAGWQLHSRSHQVAPQCQARGSRDPVPCKGSKSRTGSWPGLGAGLCEAWPFEATCGWSSSRDEYVEVSRGVARAAGTVPRGRGSVRPRSPLARTCCWYGSRHPCVMGQTLLCNTGEETKQASWWDMLPKKQWFSDKTNVDNYKDTKHLRVHVIVHFFFFSQSQHFFNRLPW